MGDFSAASRGNGRADRMKVGEEGLSKMLPELQKFEARPGCTRILNIYIRG
jgi:hypothetical protein